MPFVHSVRDRRGRTRHYFRRAGFKSVRLPGLPGSGEFNRAYEAATDETTPRIEIGASRNKPGSVAAAVAVYFGSIAFGNLAPGTRGDRRRLLEHFRESYGELSFATLRRKNVEDMLALKRATPHAARNFLKALRGMIAVAIAAGLRDDDPTLGIRNVKARDSGGYRTWTEEEIAQFEAAHPIGTRARLAFALLLYTAQRRGDVIRMGRQHARDGFIAVRQQKTGVVLQIPVHPDLQEILAAHPADHLTFLTTKAGEPFAAGGFTHWFGGLCRAAGLPPGLSAHGLRKAWCRRAAEAGCSEKQIAAISGHATLAEVSRYTKAADQKRLAEAAMQTIAPKPKTGTPSGKPSSASGKQAAQPLEKKG